MNNKEREKKEEANEDREETCRKERIIQYFSYMCLNRTSHTRVHVLFICIAARVL